MAYDIIFFDLDGTLIDPNLGITKGVQHALDKFGISESIENLKHFVGPPLHKSFHKYYGFPEKQALQAVEYYREYYIPIGMYEGTKYNGITELLTRLKNANKKVSIVTSKPNFLAKEIIRFHKMDSFFEEIKGCLPDLSNADKTTLIKEMLETRSEEKNSVVMIGDREFDIIGAKENGIDSIGVLYGYGSREEIINAAPTHVVQSVEELENYLV
ncbi:MAG TPA: HAD hydrolase-like protein [Patescibacteria group bacterium]|nr:HAD hydrolase-like protein [Patescibacteria group bacterium]